MVVYSGKREVEIITDSDGILETIHQNHWTKKDCYEYYDLKRNTVYRIVDGVHLFVTFRDYIRRGSIIDQIGSVIEGEYINYRPEIK